MNPLEPLPSPLDTTSDTGIQPDVAITTPSSTSASDASGAGSTTTTTTTTTTATTTTTTATMTTVKPQRNRGLRPNEIIIPAYPCRRHSSRSVAELRRPRTPQKGSLHYLLRQHPRVTLHTRPMTWTPLHLHLLGIQFVELPPCNTPDPSQTPLRRNQNELSKSAQRLCANLKNVCEEVRVPATHTARDAHVDSVAWLVDGLFPEKTPTSCVRPADTWLPFYFGGRPYTHLCPAELAWCSPSEEFPGYLRPQLAYVSKAYLRQRRDRMFNVPPRTDGKPNLPVMSLARKKNKLYLPANRDTDPYIVAVLIAMAQKWFYKPTYAANRYRGPRPVAEIDGDFKEIKLRILTSDDSEHFSVYTASLTAAFLRRLHSPFRSPLPDAGLLAVEHTKVKAWPVLGLKERLGKALGSDVMGAFDENNLEMWDANDDQDGPSGSGSGSGSDTEVCSDVEGVLRQRSGTPRKRKRGGSCNKNKRVRTEDSTSSTGSGSSHVSASTDSDDARDSVPSKEGSTEAVGEGEAQ